MDGDLEKFRVQMTKFEMKLRNFLKDMKKLYREEPRIARRELDKVRSQYLLDETTIFMFKRLGLLMDYTLLLKDYNRALDEIS